MEVLPTRLAGPLLLAPTVFGDSRGFFVETFRATTIGELVGEDPEFVQDNHSRSARGVIRGMHFQLEPPTAKLVRCARGAIVDVLVDVRPESETFGQWEAYRLDDENLRMLYAPAGFAHGFCVVSDLADVIYKQTAYWTPSADLGFNPEDPDVAIAWPIRPEARLLSERDRDAPSLAEVTATLKAVG
jgi:dTDP-4-dehydrorhamnose 3,5-epimerase